MVSFIITPLVSLCATYFFSYLDLMIRGDRARRPLIIWSFDDDEAKIDVNQESSYEKADATAMPVVTNDDGDKLRAEDENEEMVA